MSNVWFGIARDDLAAAEAMYDAGHYLYTAFMCQQSVEKALKGLIQHSSGGFPPRIHSLERLAELAGVHADVERQWSTLLSELEPFYIQARYPEYREQMKRSVTKELARGFLDRTEGLLQWLSQRAN